MATASASERHRPGPVGRALIATRERTSLIVVAIVSTAATAMVSSALQDDAPLRSAALGIVAGLAIGLVAVAIARRRDGGSAATAVGRAALVAPHRVLGTIPPDDRAWPISDLVAGDPSPAVQRLVAELAALHPPRRVIQFVPVRPCRVATLLALQYGRAAANPRSTSLVVDAGVDDPTLHRALGLVGTRGLADNLGGDALATTVQPIGHDVSVLASGRIVGHPMVVLGSRRMDSLVDEMRDQAGQVVLVSPPISTGGAATAVSRLVDAVVLVVSAGTPAAEVRDAVHVLESTGVAFAGVVFEAHGTTPSSVSHAAAALADG